MANSKEGQDLRGRVEEGYARTARVHLDLTPAQETSGGCCGGAARPIDPISQDLYSDTEFDAAHAVSLGCGNPTALVALSPGEDVLDGTLASAFVRASKPA